MRYLLLLFIFTIPINIVSQTQQGIVKTRGRMVNGKLQPGKGIQGATIIIKDRSAVLSGANGKFSFPLRSNMYMIESVTKQGYRLVDMDICRNYQYSPTPLYFVMENPVQQVDEKIAVERKLRYMFERKLHEREAELDAMKEQNRITQEEYRFSLQQLYNQQDNNKELISQLAARYISIDYDQIDEEDRIVNEFIYSGQFEKADSILKKKGDFKTRLERLQRESNTVNEEKKFIDQALNRLEKAKATYLKDVEDFGRDCYAKFELNKMSFKADSAAYYIELRAKSDTTNVEWMYDASFFLAYTIADLKRAVYYCDKAIYMAMTKYGEESRQLVTCYLLKSNLFQMQAQFDNSLEYIQKALNISKKIKSYGGQALCYRDMSLLCKELERISEAEKWVKEEEIVLKKIYGENAIELAELYQRLANILLHKGESSAAAQYHEKALNMLKATYGEDHEETAFCYHTLSIACMSLNHYPLALDYLNKELDIYMRTPDSYNGQKGQCYQLMGTIYEMGEGDNLKRAQDCIEQAIDLLSKARGNSHPDLSKCYLQMSLIKMKMKQYDESERYSNKALDLSIKVYGINHPLVSLCYDNIGSMYAMSGDYDHALNYFLKSEKILKDVYGEDAHTVLAHIYVFIGLLYLAKDDMAKADDYYRKVERIAGITENIPMVNQLRMLIDATKKLKKNQ